VSRIFFGDPKAIEDELATAVADAVQFSSRARPIAAADTGEPVRPST
jgi:hypothetical protein